MMFSRFLPILQQKNKSISSSGPEREFAQRPGARGAVQVGWADREGAGDVSVPAAALALPFGNPCLGRSSPFCRNPRLHARCGQISSKQGGVDVEAQMLGK